jgi:hypothetical protein
MKNNLDVFLNNSFNVVQLKILLSLYKEDNKTILDIANTLEFTPKKILNELKKITHDDIEIGLDEQFIKIEIGNDEFFLEKGKVGATKIITKLDEKENVAQDVFEFWKTTMINPDGKMKKTRFTTYKSVIVNALRDYSAIELKQAILGCSKTLWNMGYDHKGNPTNKRYDSLELILRPNKIENFLNQKDSPLINDQLATLKGEEKPNSKNDRQAWLEERMGSIGN